MAAPRRTSIQIEHDRREIATSYLRGKTQAQIAEQLDISRAMVTYDLEVIQERWRQDTTRDLDADKARELAKLDHLERTYWAAWESSLGQREITATEQAKGGKTGDRSKATIRRELRDGNPAFLEGVMKCIERRCKLLGIDAPVKADVHLDGLAGLSKRVAERQNGHDTNGINANT